MPLDLLDLPVPVIEQLARVRLDEPISGFMQTAPRKTFVFWILRELGHPGLYATAWYARHSVLNPTLPNLAWMGDAEWCRVLLEGGADVEAEGRGGNRALHIAAMNGHTAALELLLQRGADIGAIDGLGNLAHHHAANNGHTAALALLLERGAAVDAVNVWGYRALDRAAAGGHSDAVALLRTHGATMPSE